MAKRHRWILSVLAFIVGAAAASARTDKWLYVKAPSFTLITTLDAKRAISWADDFSQFVGALDEFITVDKSKLPQLTVVVFADEDEFARFRPLDAAGKPKEVAGFFSRHESWAVAGLAENELNANSKETFFHEGTHWFLSGFEYPNPMWIEEGIAETFSTFKVEDKTVSWGQAIPQHVILLAQGDQIPLQQLLGMTPDDLFHGGSEGDSRTGLIYAESWAFVHYLVFGRRDVPQTGLAEYMKLLRTAPSRDEAFRAAFGQDYRALDKKLAAYLNGGKYYIHKQPRLTLPPVTPRPATPAEVEDALGRLDLAAGRLADAQAHAGKSAALNAEDPKGETLLGEIYSANHEEENALAAYRTAIAKGSRDFRPYFAVAFAEFSSGKSWDSSLNLDAGQARHIASLYERVINLNPHFLPAYQNLAGILDLLPELGKDDHRFLEYGEKIYPADGMIRIGLAVVARKSKDDDKARSLLTDVLDPASRQPRHVVDYAQRIESEWAQNEVSEQLQGLFDGRKFAEVVTLVDQQLATPMAASQRRYFVSLRVQAVALRKMDGARAALQERRWAEARKILNEVRESDAPAQVKAEAKKQLERLDASGLDPATGADASPAR